MIGGSCFPDVGLVYRQHDDDDMGTRGENLGEKGAGVRIKRHFLR